MNWRKLFGLKPKKVIVIPDEGDDALAQVLQRVLETGKPVHAEVDEDGTIHFIDEEKS